MMRDFHMTDGAKAMQMANVVVVVVVIKEEEEEA
jgi:hypothetical protein